VSKVSMLIRAGLEDRRAFKEKMLAAAGTEDEQRFLDSEQTSVMKRINSVPGGLGTPNNTLPSTVPPLAQVVTPCNITTTNKKEQ